MALKEVAMARGRQLSTGAKRGQMSVIFSSLQNLNNNQKVSPLSDPCHLGHATATKLNFGIVSQFNTKMNRDQFGKHNYKAVGQHTSKISANSNFTFTRNCQFRVTQEEG